MNKQIIEVKSTLAIHIESLHTDAQEQPMLANEAGEAAAEAKMLARQKKMEHEEARAAADKEVRLFPDRYGVNKVTETVVASAVILHPEVQRTRDDWIVAERDADVAASLREAYQHRKSMLQMEATLYVANYLGEVGVSTKTMERSTKAGLKQTEEQLNHARRKKIQDD